MFVRSDISNHITHFSYNVNAYVFYNEHIDENSHSKQSFLPKCSLKALFIAAYKMIIVLNPALNPDEDSTLVFWAAGQVRVLM